jgi:N-acetylglucosaminyl-diphospho-decaprenol L-rhamnosyltransferase
MDVSIVIVNWNTSDLLTQCLQSVYATADGLTVEVVVVDNGSSDGSVDMVNARFRQVQVIANADNVGFIRANNQAFPLCRGRYILLLNSDARLLPASLSEAVRFMDTHPGAGLVGARLLNPDGTFQASYTPFPTLWRELLILTGLGRLLIRPTFPSSGPEIEKGAQRISGYVEGAFMLVQRDALGRVGMLDEQAFMYSEDVDWCYRFQKAGYELWYLPHTPVVHHRGQSSRKRPSETEVELYRSRVCFFGRHYGAGAALALKALIYLLTAVKTPIYHGLRIVTRGERGRALPTWRMLRVALGDIDTTHGGAGAP